MTGQLAHEATLPTPDWVQPGVRLGEDQQSDIRYALPWAAEAVGLPPPDKVRTVSQESIEVVLKGYRAFVSGDLETIAALLAPEVEWSGTPEAPASARRDDVLEVLEERLSEGYRVELERCIGVGDRVVVSARFARSGGDPDDDRPLQTRRYYTVGRYAAIVTISDGRVARVEDYPHLAAALESVGVDVERH